MGRNIDSLSWHGQSLSPRHQAFTHPACSFDCPGIQPIASLTVTTDDGVLNGVNCVFSPGEKHVWRMGSGLPSEAGKRSVFDAASGLDSSQSDPDGSVVSAEDPDRWQIAVSRRRRPSRDIGPVFGLYRGVL